MNFIFIFLHSLPITFEAHPYSFFCDKFFFYSFNHHHLPKKRRLWIYLIVIFIIQPLDVYVCYALKDVHIIIKHLTQVANVDSLVFFLIINQKKDLSLVILQNLMFFRFHQDPITVFIFYKSSRIIIIMMIWCEKNTSCSTNRFIHNRWWILFNNPPLNYWIQRCEIFFFKILSIYLQKKNQIRNSYVCVCVINMLSFVYFSFVKLEHTGQYKHYSQQEQIH